MAFRHDKDFRDMKKQESLEERIDNFTKAQSDRDFLARSRKEQQAREQSKVIDNILTGLSQTDGVRCQVWIASAFTIAIIFFGGYAFTELL